MKLAKAFILTLFLFTATLHAKWYDNEWEAQQAAARLEKPLLIAFLGPEWCLWSDHLETEILSKQEFIDEMEKNFVLLKVGIPEDFEEQNFQGKNLSKSLRIEECPTIVLATPLGQEISTLPYLPVDYKEFTASICETLGDYRKMSSLTKVQLEEMQTEELMSLYVRAGRLADQTFKKALLDQGLKNNSSPYFLLEKYHELLTAGKLSGWKVNHLRKQIVERDPENKEGSLRKMAVMDFEALSRSKRFSNAEVIVKPLVEYLRTFGQTDHENAWKIEMKIAQYFYTKNRTNDALHHANASLALAPDSMKKEIEQSIEYLQKHLQ